MLVLHFTAASQEQDYVNYVIENIIEQCGTIIVFIQN